MATFRLNSSDRSYGSAFALCVLVVLTVIVLVASSAGNILHQPSALRWSYHHPADHAAQAPSTARLGAQMPSWHSSTTTLSRVQLEKGIVSYGATCRARRAMAKLLRGEPITVAFIGGSITWGQGASQQGFTDYAPRVRSWLNATFGDKHVVMNGAVPGTPSSYFAMCHEWHVPRHADIIVVEFNINDGGAKGDAAIRRAHERLLRKLLAYQNRPAVLEMVFYRYPDNPESPTVYRYHGDDEIGVLAQYYHLPWMSIRSLAWDYLPDMAQDNISITDAYVKLWNGPDHPSDIGHQWMADMIVHWMQETLDDLVRDPLGPLDENEAHAEQPLPLFKGNWESKNNTCLMADQVKALVTSHDPAFQWINEGTDKKPKWGYISDKPGSSLHLILKTNVSRGMGPETNVSLSVGHLKSYEHMGWFEVTCVEGCICDPMKRDGHHTEKVSQLYHAKMQVSASDACHLQFTVLPETTSGEHKFKLMSLVVSEVVVDQQDWHASVEYSNGADGQHGEYIGR